MSTEIVFSRENLDDCFRRLAKEYKRLSGKAIPAEIVLIGGASVLTNYGFRDTTYNVDAIINASSAMEDAVNRVADDLGLPNGWLNQDFKKTKSYSPKLINYSVYYKTFANILTVRTISGEYLVAMKLMSGRKYKNDISDIVGILREQREKGTPITFEQIDLAVNNLYGNWDEMPDDAEGTIRKLLDNRNLDELYRICRKEEINSRNALLDFEKECPDVVTLDNVDDVLKVLRMK